ncbi:nitroreductase family protein, partial [Salipaludibacillus sp. CF4.18]|uniref:nitroreductase family protein n=1 Tax=Salipaludibacillus sp. CF4.18 TaxID=3373081 RepID=UPI003EE68836
MIKKPKPYQKEGIAKIIRERRTIRDLKPDPVSVDLIVDILNDAVWAPNHGLREPWRFLLFHGTGKDRFVEAGKDATSSEDREKYGNKKDDYFRNVPIHLVVIMKEDLRE